MAQFGGRITTDRTQATLGGLAFAATGLVVWTVLSGMADAVRVAVCGAILGLLLLVRAVNGPWLPYAAAMVAALMGLVVLRMPGVVLRYEAALWLFFATVAVAMLYLVGSIRRQSFPQPPTGPRGTLRFQVVSLFPGLGADATYADLGVAAGAPFCGAAMVLYLTTGMPPLLRGVLVLTVLGVLLQGVVTRRHWLAYAAATVAVLAALASAKQPLPPAALAGQWLTFAVVVGVVLFLVARLRTQGDELRTADDMKDRFIALANHELRTPVAVMYSVLETLEDDLETALSPQQQSFLRAARASSHALAERVELLTQLHQLQQEQSPDPTCATFGDTLRSLTRELGDLERRVGFHVVLSDAAADVSLPQIDTTVVLRQIISNAVKFSPENGVVSLDARIDGSELLCEVTDDGPGIPPGAESALFEPFFQPGDLLRREVDGLGVGLSLARLASKRMGATVSIRNNPHGGACVSVRIPMPEPAAVPFAKAARRSVPA
jgi:signal transduction histidine kinase